MKKIFLILPAILLFLASCDRIELPYKPVITLDTTLFSDGVWADYPWPTFDDNTNTLRNVIIEDYTGHKCPNCPKAATIAKGIEDSNPGRVFVASIHTGPGGSVEFQFPLITCGDLIANPQSKYCHDFRTDEGEEYGATFQTGYGFSANPNGTISRVAYDNFNVFSFYTVWDQITTAVLNMPLEVNLQAKSNYYESTNGAFLHVEAEFLTDVDKSINMVTYVLENEIIAWQDSSGFDLEFYHHHNVFLGCIDGLAFGQNIGTSFQAGDKVQHDYSYTLPEGKTKEELHFLTYVFDEATYEILQVIKHEL